MNSTTKTAPATVTHSQYGYEIRIAGKLVACTASRVEADALAASF